MDAAGARHVSRCCQGCLSIDGLRSLTEEVLHDGVKELYMDMFLECFNLEIGERFTNEDLYFICVMCSQRLTDASRFRKLVVSSQEFLRQSAFIKEETPEDYDATVVCDSNEDEPAEVKVKVDLDIPEEPDTIESDVIKLEESSKAPSQLKRPKKRGARQSKTPKGQNKTANRSAWLKHESPDETGHYAKPKRKSKKRNDNEIKCHESDLPMDIVTLTCKLCDQKFDNINVLRRHMAEHHYPSHLCDVCGSVFREPRHLKNHQQSHKVIKCEKCDKVLKETSYRKHLYVSHSGKKKVYCCPVCKEEHTSDTKRKTHMRNAHGINTGGSCYVCSKTFTFKSNLRLHIKGVHQKAAPCVCNMCGKGFLNNHALRRHMLKHTGIRNHVCPVCSKAYLKKDTLTAHMKIHNSVKDFVCSLCAKSFTYKCSLKGHMKTHHPSVDFDGGT